MTTVEAAGSSGAAAGQTVVPAIVWLLVICASILARRNARLGRGDRRGATRLAAVYVGLGATSALLRVSGDPSWWMFIFFVTLGFELLSGFIVWVSYLATEPYVRRLWPGTIVAWSRVLEGRFRDPLVGRHILLGALSGLGFGALFSSPAWLASVLGFPPPQPFVDYAPATSTAVLVASYSAVLLSSLRIPVTTLLFVLLMRVIFKRPWAAYAALLIVFGILVVVSQGHWVPKVLAILTFGFSVLVVTRLGLFALCVSVFFSSWEYFLLTTDTSSWLFPSSVVTMLVFATIAVYGCMVSIGDQKVFKDSILDGPRA